MRNKDASRKVLDGDFKRQQGASRGRRLSLGRRLLHAAGITYIIAVHVLLAVLVFKTNFLVLAGKTLGMVPPEEWTTSFLRQVLQQAAEDTDVPPHAVILVGDSLIAELPATAIDRRAVNYGLGGDTTHTLLARLPVLRGIATSRAVVLGVGVNDLKYRPVHQIEQDYARLLTRLSTVRMVLAVPVLPVIESGNAARRRPYLRNTTIAILDRGLSRLCAQQTNCRFLNIRPFVTATDRISLYGNDGWHLSAAGANELARLIRNALSTVSP